MDALEALFRPLTALVNKQIKATTPAREICAELDGKVIAVRVKDTALAIYFGIFADEITPFGDLDGDPDAVITGSIVALARLVATGDDQVIRDGSVELTGDAEVAQSFQRLLGYGRPDIEEELSQFVGDVAAHRLGEVARGFSRWGRETASTFRQNITEYLQEERRDLPTRHEVEAFARRLDTLRDDVARLEARMNRLDPPD